MAKSIIVAGFPGVGKSYICQNEQKIYWAPKNGVTSPILFNTHDSDSSKFSWIYDENGNKTDQRNPEFPGNYIEHIKKLYDEENNIIFVSTHKEVREALLEAGFHFWIVLPVADMKEEYLEIYRERGNDEKFIQLIDNNWGTWIKELKDFSSKNSKVLFLEIYSSLFDHILDIIQFEHIGTMVD